MIKVGRYGIVVGVQERFDLAEACLNIVVLAVVGLAEERVTLAYDIPVVLQEQGGIPAFRVDYLGKYKVKRAEQSVRHHKCPVGAVLLRFV